MKDKIKEEIERSFNLAVIIDKQYAEGIISAEDMQKAAELIADYVLALDACNG